MLQRFLVPFLATTLLFLSACKEDTADAISRVKQEWAERSAKIELIKDTPTRENFDQMARFLKFMEVARIEAKAPPKATRYTDPDLVRLQDYDAPAQMAEVFQKTLVIESFSTSLTLQEAFRYPLPYEINLASVLLADGQQVMVSDDYSPEGPKVQAGREGGRIRMVYDPSGSTPEGQAMPTHVTGTFTTDLPGDVLRVEFGQNETGKTRQIGDYAVTLLKIDGHQVAVEIKRVDGAMPTIETDAILIEGRDKTGRFLDDSGSGWGNPEDFSKLTTALDMALVKAVGGEMIEADPDALFEKISLLGGLKESRQLYGEVDFRGVANQVLVTILAPAGGRKLSQDISLPVLALERFRYAQAPDVIAVSGPVYAHELEGVLKYQPVDLDAAQIATAISVTHSGYANSLSFNYPDVQSDIFIDGFERFDDRDMPLLVLTFLDANGDQITTTDEAAYEFTVNRIEYDPALFPSPPVRVRGLVPVQRLTSMARVDYTPDDLPKTLIIKGNMLLIRGDEMSGLDDENLALFATDSDGRHLLMLHQEILKAEGADGLRQIVQHYYGDIGGVTLLSRGDIETLPYAFDMALEPVER